MHIRQSEVTALKAIGELLVVEAEEVQDGGLEVVDVDFVLYDRETEFICLAVTAATLDAAAREENREGVGEMIAS